MKRNIYIYICIHIGKYICTHTHTHTHIYIYIYVCMHTYLKFRMQTCYCSKAVHEILLTRIVT